MDIRIVFLSLFIPFFVGFLWGFIRGMIFGSHLAVKAYLNEQNAFDGPVPAAWMEYYQDVRKRMGDDDELKEARSWTRKHNLPFNAETVALFRNDEYRSGLRDN
jgi:hypothetical protein